MFGIFRRLRQLETRANSLQREVDDLREYRRGHRDPLAVADHAVNKISALETYLGVGAFVLPASPSRIEYRILKEGA
jgi:hypothetical protein